MSEEEERGSRCIQDSIHLGMVDKMLWEEEEPQEETRKQSRLIRQQMIQEDLNYL